MGPILIMIGERPLVYCVLDKDENLVMGLGGWNSILEGGALVLLECLLIYKVRCNGHN
jgi:hypothetical protein